MRIFSLLVTLLLLTQLYGCQTLGGRGATVEATVNTYLLREEFESAAETLRAVPFNAEERALVESQLSAIETLVDAYENTDTEQLILTVLQTRAVFDEVVSRYEIIERTYKTYRQRTDMPVDPFLDAYHTSAQVTYNAIDKLLAEADQNSFVDPKVAAGYIGLVLRILATRSI